MLRLGIENNKREADLLLWVVGRVSEDAREQPPPDTIATLNKEAGLVGGHEVVVEKQEPDFAKQLLFEKALRGLVEGLVMRSFVGILEIIWEL